MNQKVKVPDWYSFVDHYPILIYTEAVQSKYGRGKINLTPADISWTFDSDGNFKSSEYKPIIAWDKNSKQ